MEEFTHLNKTKQIIATVLAVMSFAIGIFTLHVKSQETAIAQTETTPIEFEYPNPFDQIDIQGKSAYVVDMNTGTVLYEKNAQEPLPLASVTKVMTALTAMEVSANNTVVAINQDSLSPEGDNGLLVQERWKLDNLVDFMLVQSSNDGAAAVAQTISRGGSSNSFIDEMNRVAKKIGLTTSEFHNVTGLDISSQKAGAYGSAEDMAKLYSYVLTNYPEIFEATRYDEIKISSEDGYRYDVHNTNKAISKIPNLIASKTGYTLLAGGNLAIAFDAGINRPIIIVVLGSTQEGRFKDVVELASTTLSYIGIAEK
jgi:D-alanyl-D-alanine carboxypeptidase